VTDKIDFGGQPWGAMPRSTMRDPRMSHRAKGGLTILLSHEEGWVRSCIAVLQHEGKGGRDQAQSIMKELRELGYATLITERDEEGRVRRHYEIRALPTGSEADSGGFPVDGKPNRRETQPTGNQSIEVEALDVEALDVEPKAIEPSARPRNIIWDQLAGIYGQPTATGTKERGLVVKTLTDANATPSEIAWMYRTLSGTDVGWAVMTPNAMAKHFGERYALADQLVKRVPDRGAEILREAYEEGQRAGA
jgi:hypothetical protein